jgi:hypothetical protein
MVLKEKMSTLDKKKREIRDARNKLIRLEDELRRISGHSMSKRDLDNLIKEAATLFAGERVESCPTKLGIKISFTLTWSEDDYTSIDNIKVSSNFKTLEARSLYKLLTDGGYINEDYVYDTFNDSVLESKAYKDFDLRIKNHLKKANKLEASHDLDWHAHVYDAADSLSKKIKTKIIKAK